MTSGNATAPPPGSISNATAQSPPLASEVSDLFASASYPDLAAFLLYTDVLGAADGLAGDGDAGGGGQYCRHGATFDEAEQFETIGFWIEAVALIGVGLAGLVCNTVAMTILLSRRLTNLFNRTLAILAIFDNIALICLILESVRQYVHLSKPHMYAFPHFLYPLQNVAMVASIYLTVIVALERYVAVSRPINVYVSSGSGSGSGSEELRWRRVFYYVGPVILFAVIFNLTTFFEFCLKEVGNEGDSDGRDYDDPDAGPLVSNETTYELGVTPLRENDYYILYYINLCRIPITGIVPMVALCVLNYLVYKHLVRRRATMTSLAAVRGPHFGHQMSVENRQAHTLFGVATLFFVGHILRLLLNLHELFAIRPKAGKRRTFEEELEWRLSDCASDYPLWTMIARAVSNLLITFSSSANLFVYCAASAVFRRILCEKLKLWKRRQRPKDLQRSGTTRYSNSQSLVLHRHGHGRSSLSAATNFETQI